MPEDFRARALRLGLNPADFAESFARSSGPGGQHVNKVSTAVTLRHEPSGRSVTVQDSRSQAMNRELARVRLLDAIEAAGRAERLAERSARAKERRRTAPRPRGVKRRMLADKRHRGATKAARRRAGDE
jgi:protein subunit release factor B